MIFPLMLTFCGAVFVVQLKLCVTAKPIRIKLLPAVLIGILWMVCRGVYALLVHLNNIGKGIFGASFAAPIYAAVLLAFLVSDFFAWIIFWLIRAFAKAKKDS